MEQLFVEHFVEVLNMDNNSGGSRELFRITWSFDENLCETLQHLRLVWMLLYIEVILLDVYRTSAYDAGENREPTLLNKILLKLKPSPGIEEGDFERILIAHSVTLNEPDVEIFQQCLAKEFGGKYTKSSKLRIERLVRRERLTAYPDTHPTLKYLTEMNKQIRAVGLFSNAWVHSRQSFNKVFGKYLHGALEPGRCQTVPLYSWMTGYAKPHPEAFRHAVKTLGGEAGNYLVVDDSLANVLAAQKMGMKAVLIIRDNNMCPLRIPEGVVVIHSFEPLVSALKALEHVRPLLACTPKRRPG